MWCIPPKADAEFVCAMEKMLAVYKRPYDANRPVVCFDEMSKQLVGEVRTPIPAAAGRVACHDYEYVRKGTANLVHVGRTAARLAARKRDHALDEAGLRGADEETRRCALS